MEKDEMNRKIKAKFTAIKPKINAVEIQMD